MRSLASPELQAVWQLHVVHALANATTLQAVQAVNCLFNMGGSVNVTEADAKRSNTN